MGFGAGFPALAAAWTRYYVSWADKVMGEVNGNPVQDGELSYTLPHPYGVIATIITWNSPLMWIAMKAAALATGNTVVIKPSSLTPFTGQLCMDLVEEAGFPPGVINVLPGGGDQQGISSWPSAGQEYQLHRRARHRDQDPRGVRRDREAVGHGVARQVGRHRVRGHRRPGRLRVQHLLPVGAFVGA